MTISTPPPNNPSVHVAGGQGEFAWPNSSAGDESDFKRTVIRMKGIAKVKSLVKRRAKKKSEVAKRDGNGSPNASDGSKEEEQAQDSPDMD